MKLNYKEGTVSWFVESYAQSHNGRRRASTVKTHSLQRVRYSETDAMGVVYYANYLVWFEIGRTDWFRATGKTYRTLEEEGLLLPVVEVNCRYLASTHYDDDIIIETEWEDYPELYFTFHYKILLQHDKKVLAEGWSKHLCVNKEGKIQKEATCRLKESCRNLSLQKA